MLCYQLGVGLLRPRTIRHRLRTTDEAVVLDRQFATEGQVFEVEQPRATTQRSSPPLLTLY
jgi:hypothetical protein